MIKIKFVFCCFLANSFIVNVICPCQETSAPPEEEDHCPSPGQGYTFRGLRESAGLFYKEDQLETFDEAAQTCQATSGAHLPTFKTQEEYEILLDFLSIHTKKMYKISPWSTIKSFLFLIQSSLMSQFGWDSPFQMGQAVLTSTLARAFCSGQMGLL